MMAHVHADMKKTRQHSSVAAVPAEVGTKAGGTLSADHWSTFATVHLVVTLPRKWGPPDHPQYPHLINFMHLVTALSAGSCRRLTDAKVVVYTAHTRAYLSGLLQLHPFWKLTPSQHTLLHVPRFLKSMGPTCAHRAHVFERFIYLLKAIPTNNKAGAPKHLLSIRTLIESQGRRRGHYSEK